MCVVGKFDLHSVVFGETTNWLSSWFDTGSEIALKKLVEWGNHKTDRSEKHKGKFHTVVCMPH